MILYKKWAVVMTVGLLMAQGVRAMDDGAKPPCCGSGEIARGAAGGAMTGGAEAAGAPDCTLPADSIAQLKNKPWYTYGGARSRWAAFDKDYPKLACLTRWGSAAVAGVATWVVVKNVAPDFAQKTEDTVSLACCRAPLFAVVGGLAAIPGFVVSRCQLATTKASLRKLESEFFEGCHLPTAMACTNGEPNQERFMAIVKETQTSQFQERIARMRDLVNKDMAHLRTLIKNEKVSVPTKLVSGDAAK